MSLVNFIFIDNLSHPNGTPGNEAQVGPSANPMGGVVSRSSGADLRIRRRSDHGVGRMFAQPSLGSEPAGAIS